MKLRIITKHMQSIHNFSQNRFLTDGVHMDHPRASELNKEYFIIKIINLLPWLMVEWTRPALHVIVFQFPRRHFLNWVHDWPITAPSTQDGGHERAHSPPHGSELAETQIPEMILLVKFFISENRKISFFFWKNHVNLRSLALILVPRSIINIR